MQTEQMSMRLDGDFDALRQALRRSPHEWLPGRTLMHAPTAVTAEIGMFGGHWTVDFRVDGHDLRPEKDRRRVVMRPHQQWMPEVVGLLEIEQSVADASGAPHPTLMFRWAAMNRHAPLGPMTTPLASHLVRTVIPAVAHSLEHLARS